MPFTYNLPDTATGLVFTGRRMEDDHAAIFEMAEDLLNKFVLPLLDFKSVQQDQRSKLNVPKVQTLSFQNKIHLVQFGPVRRVVNTFGSILGLASTAGPAS